MAERHDTRGKPLLTTGLIVLALCVLALVVPTSWLDRVAQLFGVEDAETPTAFAEEVAAHDAALTSGDTEPSPELEPYVLARRLTRAGPMTRAEVERAAQLWLQWSQQPDVVDRLAAEFPRLDRDKLAEEVERFRAQLSVTPGGAPGTNCASCHRKTQLLPNGHTFDVAGIYPYGADVPELEGGRRVPLLSESIELEATAATGEQHECLDCHVPHGADGFQIDRPQRIANMGLWAEVEPADPSVLHVRVKVRNNATGHLAPGGPISPAYVVVAEARQRRKPLSLRYGPRLPEQLRRGETEAGIAFTRDFRDDVGRPTTEPSQIADLVGDNRLESGRFAQLDFVFDRIDDSIAHLEVTLWHLPDVTTWKGAKAIRRADKPERPQ